MSNLCCEITPHKRFGWWLRFYFTTGLLHTHYRWTWRPTRRWARWSAERYIARRKRRNALAISIEGE